MSLSITYTPTLGFPGGSSTKIRGEATVVDLGDGKYLFALINNPIDVAENTFRHLVISEEVRQRGNSGYSAKYLFMRFWWVRDVALVKSKFYYPTLVTFEDINDPASVKLVDPNDLAATFGKGYSLKEMTLEITDEEVTIGNLKTILDYFWWEETRKEEYRCRTHGCSLTAMLIKLPNGGARPLTKSNFIRTQ
ncbi:MAG: hypothetical protein OCD03_16340 [Hyphomicrobiales bacterium]